MKAFLRAVIFLPLAAVFIGFALANRMMVSVQLDPMGLSNLPLAYDVPLFLPIFIAMMVGVLVGGVSMWLSEGRHRRAARFQRRDLERQRRENEELRRERELPPLPPSTLIG